jgi:hypothetical protein
VLRVELALFFGGAASAAILTVGVTGGLQNGGSITTPLSGVNGG